MPTTPGQTKFQWFSHVQQNTYFAVGKPSKVRDAGTTQKVHCCTSHFHATGQGDYAVLSNLIARNNEKKRLPNGYASTLLSVMEAVRPQCRARGIVSSWVVSHVVRVLCHSHVAH